LPGEAKRVNVKTDDGAEKHLSHPGSAPVGQVCIDTGIHANVLETAFLEPLYDTNFKKCFFNNK